MSAHLSLEFNHLILFVRPHHRRPHTTIISDFSFWLSIVLAFFTTFRRNLAFSPPLPTSNPSQHRQTLTKVFQDVASRNSFRLLKYLHVPCVCRIWNLPHTRTLSDFGLAVSFDPKNLPRKDLGLEGT